MWAPDSSSPRSTSTQCKNMSSGNDCCYCKPKHSLLGDVAHSLEICGTVGQDLSGVGCWRQSMVGWKSSSQPLHGQRPPSGCLLVTKWVALLWPAQEHLRGVVSLSAVTCGGCWGQACGKPCSSQKQEGEHFRL